MRIGKVMGERDLNPTLSLSLSLSINFSVAGTTTPLFDRFNFFRFELSAYWRYLRLVQRIVRQTCNVNSRDFFL
ncbi:hypothetical protein HAX54_033155 [Datura stramonium]|uniref:Uncharacterized protein n=1 Tax=Datura stramonium TaxID=4076 RepID=A0ABS8VCH8_DATST|nr:hypothetical protein [Datura stramonium]